MKDKAPADALAGRGAEPLVLGFVTLAAGARLIIEQANPWGLGMAVIAYLGLLWSRRQAHLWGVALSLSAAIVGLYLESSPDPAMGMLAGAAVYVVTVSGDRRRARMEAGIIAAIFLGAVLASQGLTFRDLFRNTAVLLAGFAAGEAVWYRRSVMAEAQERARLAELTREEEAQLRVQQERMRIARDLHDIVGHRLSIINVQAGMAAHVIHDQPAVAAAALEEIRQASQGALREMRATVGVLRAGADDASELSPMPQLADVETMVESFRQTGLSVDVHIGTDVPELEAAQELTIYRIIQEALTNVVRHAGEGRAQVSIVFPPGEVSIEVTNDGRLVTAPAENVGQGLVGMRERLAALGGTLLAGPRPEGGFRVRATFPVRS